MILLRNLHSSLFYEINDIQLQVQYSVSLMPRKQLLIW